LTLSLLDAVATVTRAVALAAIVAATGAASFRWGVLRRWPVALPAPLSAWNALVARAGAVAVVCLILVAPVRWFAQAQSLLQAGDPVAPMMLGVLHTTWGRGLLLQAVTGVAVLAGLLLARRGFRSGWIIALLSVLGLTLSPAFMGHAVAAERLLVLSITCDWIHVTLAGAWLGAVAMLALSARATATLGDGPHARLAVLIELFHPLALAGSIGLVTTGFVSLLLRVDHLEDLLHSPYGAILAVKLALALVAAGVGLYHARRGARLARSGGPRAVARSLAVESALAVLVIAATAVLVETSPPMSMAMATRAAHVPHRRTAGQNPNDAIHALVEHVP
jgi:putative copper export protein